ncbi:hypothetical protein B484DRAFT_431515, partial [Ochromonadaceae sp. CCMP2298]
MEPEEEGEEGGEGGARRRSLLPDARKAPQNPSLSQSQSQKRNSTRPGGMGGTGLAGGWEAPGKDKSGKLLNQPITFQPRVRSSGYGQESSDPLERLRVAAAMQKKKRAQAVVQEKAQMQMQRARDVQMARIEAQEQGTWDGTEDEGGGGGGGSRLRRYPIDCAVTDAPLYAHTYYGQGQGAQGQGGQGQVQGQGGQGQGQGAPISGISFSSDGSLLAIASADPACCMLRLSKQGWAGEGAGAGMQALTFAGHDSRITSVSLSHSRTADEGKRKGLAPPPQYALLTASADGTARMWRTRGSETVRFSHYKHSVSNTGIGGGIGGGRDGGIAGVTGSHSSTGMGASMGMASMGTGRSIMGVSGTKSAKTAPAQRNRPFGDAVSYCSYFYQDAFALL